MLDGRMHEVTRAADLDPAGTGMLNVDGGIGGRRRDKQFEPGKLVQQRGRERGALPHRDDHVKASEFLCGSLPTAEVLDVKLKKSSGNRAYDDAVQRAILKSSPLPRPERSDVFQRVLELRVRPRD